MVSLSSLRRGLVLAGLLYYWAYLYLRVLLPSPEHSPVAYLVTVVPIAVFASLGTGLHLIADRRKRAPRAMIGCLLAFVAAVVVASVPRGDAPTVLSAGLLALTLIWLTTAPAVIKLATINRVFVLSVLVAGIFYAFGWSEYGLLPGQYREGEDRGITWRVSLFPYVAESGFFALIVLLANQMHGRGLRRAIYVAAALYFLLLSGVRSALLGWLLCLVFMAIDRHCALAAQHRFVRLRLALIAGLLLSFLAIVLSSTALQFFPELTQGPLGSYLLRAAADDVGAESIGQSVYRGWLWVQHIDLFVSSPLVGVGQYEFASLTSRALFRALPCVPRRACDAQCRRSLTDAVRHLHLAGCGGPGVRQLLGTVQLHVRAPVRPAALGAGRVAPDRARHPLAPSHGCAFNLDSRSFLLCSARNASWTPPTPISPSTLPGCATTVTATRACRANA